MIEKKIIKILEENIKDGKVFIQDITGSNNHFNLIVISSVFDGLTMIQQHQVIYKLLGSMITKEIHALQIKTLTWKQWKKEN
jgi:acid stress-induced BolA-like protein IbaG/YrbA|tara:strand:+ start:41 stop:286 length:246 start_codon:yes stop_codon:yes gene_type:complete